MFEIKCFHKNIQQKRAGLITYIIVHVYHIRQKKVRVIAVEKVRCQEKGCIAWIVNKGVKVTTVRCKL